MGESNHVRRYRTRPREVEAVRYTAETCAAMHEWLGCVHVHPRRACGDSMLKIADFEVWHGDWLVRLDNDVVLAPMPDDEFRERFEPAGDGREE